MQYHIQTLVKHLFDKDSFEQVTEQELKQFTDDYPYAAVGQFLYAKKLKDIGSYNHYEQGEQASLYFHNALWLRFQLDQKEDAPVIPVKAEEPAQQPGFRIVVQMPKTDTPFSNPPLAVQPETPGEEETALPAAAADVPAEPVQETTAPATEEPVKEEQEISLQVNEDGSLVEQEEAPQQGETASAVAIAETSQLAEENNPAETAANAVSITEEVLIPPTTVSGEIDKEADEIVPAVEVTRAELETVPMEDDIVPAVEVTKVEMEVTAQADDIVPAVEIAPEELAAIAPQTIGETVQAPAEIAIEEQSVEEINEIIPAAEPVAIEAQAPTQPAGFTAATQEGRMSVDLGEPVFESYHTIDYFASQGIKLLQEELKDKLGKQLKSFTDWLRSMKRVGPVESTSLDEITNQSIQRIAEHSVEEKEVLTEAMAEVWAKQGNTNKAIRVYEKLSLLNPAKSPYFAGRIEQLKAQ
ncbi:MAG: hypothetical protein ACJ751_28445 [Niastella sp.]|uniref:hypothetical protein n=1 Tax=Niastella sp. TaxID=1869183 RepID=UPI00389A559A